MVVRLRATFASLLRSSLHAVSTAAGSRRRLQAEAYPMPTMPRQSIRIAPGWRREAASCSREQSVTTPLGPSPTSAACPAGVDAK
jgi:hypothetical protein